MCRVKNVPGQKCVGSKMCRVKNVRVKNVWVKNVRVKNDLIPKQTCVRNIPIMCKILNVIYNRSSKYLLSAKQKKAMNGEKRLQCQHL